MATYQVFADKEQAPAPPPKKRRHISQEGLTVLRAFIALNLVGGLFGLIITFAHFTDAIFFLLPVFVSFAFSLVRSYNRNTFLHASPRYLLLTLALSFGYSGVVSGFELLTHLGADLSHIILVMTTLAWAIILEPARAYFQTRIEMHFNRSNHATAALIEKFLSTLREEIDLVQLHTRFLTVIRQTMRPYSLSFWIRTLPEQQEQAELAPVSEEVPVAENDPLVQHLLRNPGVTELDKLRIDTPFLQNLKASQAEIVLPLTSQGDLIGLLALGPRLNDALRVHPWLALPLIADPLLLLLLLFGLRVDGRGYTREERSLLATLAAQVAPALRVAQLVREQQREVRARERIEQELRTAQAIQQTFLPREVPVFPGWQLIPHYQPAREVGGDFYDFLLFEDGCLGLVIGDVTGKGVPAALVMATVHTMLRTVALNKISPAAVLAQVNDLLVKELPSGMFVTCFYALLDPRSGRFSYANAGQEAPYRCLNGGAGELPATGMPLGMLPGIHYEEYEATLAAGESLFFYSDGLIEAHNANREMFGFPRLHDLLTHHGHGRETSLIDVVLNEWHTFTGTDWEQEDDLTLLILRRIARTQVLE